MRLDEEPALLKQMIEYLYTLDYQVETPVIAAGDAGSEQNMESRPFEESPTSDVPKSQEAFNIDNNIHAPEEAAPPWEPLSFHIQMYSLADRLLIQGLKVISAQKTKSELVQRLDAISFPAAIIEIYNTTPENDRGLRDLAVQVTMEHLATLRRADETQAAAFQDGLLKSVPQFSYDLVLAMIRKYVPVELAY